MCNQGEVEPVRSDGGARFHLSFVYEVPTEKRYMDSALLEVLQRVEEAVRAAGGAGGRPPPPGLDLERVRVALREALANAAEHGNGYRPERRIRVQGRVDAGALWLEVEDEGEGFDVEATRRALRDASRRRERGRGLLFLEGLTDELRFEKGGSRLVLGFTRKETP